MTTTEPTPDDQSGEFKPAVDPEALRQAGREAADAEWADKKRVEKTAEVQKAAEAFQVTSDLFKRVVEQYGINPDNPNILGVKFGRAGNIESNRGEKWYPLSINKAKDEGYMVRNGGGGTSIEREKNTMFVRAERITNSDDRVPSDNRRWQYGINQVEAAANIVSVLEQLAKGDIEGEIVLGPVVSKLEQSKAA